MANKKKFPHPFGFKGTDKQLVELIPQLPEFKALVKAVEEKAIERAEEMCETGEIIPGLIIDLKTKYPAWNDPDADDEVKYQSLQNAGINLDRKHAFQIKQPVSIRRLLTNDEKDVFDKEVAPSPVVHTLVVDENHVPES